MKFHKRTKDLLGAMSYLDGIQKLGMPWWKRTWFSVQETLLDIARGASVPYTVFCGDQWKKHVTHRLVLYVLFCYCFLTTRPTAKIYVSLLWALVLMEVSLILWSVIACAVTGVSSQIRSLERLSKRLSDGIEADERYKAAWRAATVDQRVATLWEATRAREFHAMIDHPDWYVTECRNGRWGLSVKHSPCVIEDAIKKHGKEGVDWRLPTEEEFMVGAINEADWFVERTQAYDPELIKVCDRLPHNYFSDPRACLLFFGR